MTIDAKLARLAGKGAVIRPSSFDGNFLVRGTVWTANPQAFGRYDTEEAAVEAVENFLKEHQSD